MPSINDVLKEKFKVTGNNIAETLSKIEPGSGSGSGSSGSLIVNPIDNETTGKLTLDKTAGEILDAALNVILVGREEIEETVEVHNYPLHSYIVQPSEYKFFFQEVGTVTNDYCFRTTSLESYPEFYNGDSEEHH